MTTTVFLRFLRPAALPVALLLTGTACGPGDTSASGDDVTLRSRRGRLERRLVLTGRLEAVHNTVLHVPKTSEGRITLQWLAEDGAGVGKGDPIAEFDPSPFSTTLESSRNQVLVARRTLSRLQKQAEADGEESNIQHERTQAAFAKAELDASVPAELKSRQEYEKSVLALEQARAALLKSEEDQKAQRSASATRVKTQQQDLMAAQLELKRAEEALTVVSLTAPTDGILVIADHPQEGRRIQVGDTLWSGLTVGKIPDLSRIRVRAVLWDVDDGSLAPGMKARCTLDAVPERHFEGRVSNITPVAQEVRIFSLRRGFNVTIDLDKVDPDIARPGMSVHVDIALPVPNDAVLIPRSCLVFDEGEWFAFLSNGTLREVTLGPCSAQECEVTSGLDEGVALMRRKQP